jgi:curli biogenesis system outer membrane secretion channel CsgG
MPQVSSLLSTPIRQTLQVLGLAAAAALTGCSALEARRDAQALPAPEAAILSGSSSRNNTTPMEPAFACFAKSYGAVKVPVVSIAVGELKDYTGKTTLAEGSAITQGGSLMLYSALGKMGSAVRLQERFDTRIAELELAYADRRQLGDGNFHTVEAGKPNVPWLPYLGGSILRSDYYIVGGITEVNYNIQSRGAEVSVSNIGGKVRTFTMNVGVDLRIVDSRSLLVVKTVSMQKQITGTEVGAGIFRFFGTELLDVNMGSKNQEPLQLGVRTTIEHGLLELLGAISGLSVQPCVDYALKGKHDADKLQAAVDATIQPALAAAALKPPAPQPVPQPAAPAPKAVQATDAPPKVPTNVPTNAPPSVPTNAPQNVPASDAKDTPVPANGAPNRGKSGAKSSKNIEFEPHKTSLDGAAQQALRALESPAADSPKSASIPWPLAETDLLPSAQRRQGARKRVRAVAEVWVAKGVPASPFALLWSSEASVPVQRHSADKPLVAHVSVTHAKPGGGG